MRTSRAGCRCRLRAAGFSQWSAGSLSPIILQSLNAVRGGRLKKAKFYLLAAGVRTGTLGGLTGVAAVAGFILEIGR